MKLRMIVDTVMLFLFLAILDYRQIGSSHHEIFGMIFFVIVIFHNYLNRQWYKSLPRGRWNWDRRFTFLIDVVLIGSFLAVMITAPLISYKLSLDINAPLIVHRIHRIGGYVMLGSLQLGCTWGFTGALFFRVSRRLCTWEIRRLFPFSLRCLLWHWPLQEFTSRSDSTWEIVFSCFLSRGHGCARQTCLPLFSPI